MLRRPSSLLEVSERSYELCPAQTQLVRPAIFLRRDVERVTGAEAYTTIKHELKRIAGGKQLHGATTACELKDVTLSDGSLFKDGWKTRVRKRTACPRTAEERLAHGTIASTYLGSLYFGHWITEDLTLCLAAERTGDPVIPDGPQYAHAEAYQRLVGVQPLRLTRAHFKRLTLLEDVGQNSYKGQRYQQIRARLAAAAGRSDSVEAGKRVVLHRGGKAQGRLLVNGREMEELLERLGFIIVDPSTMSADQVVKQCSGAEIVLGVEGSQLSHALYTMGMGGVFCALQPPHRFNNIFKDHCDCIGLRYAFLTGERAEGGFRVSLDEIRELVDRLDQIVSARDMSTSPLLPPVQEIDQTPTFTVDNRRAITQTSRGSSSA